MRRAGRINKTSESIAPPMLAVSRNHRFKQYDCNNYMLELRGTSRGERAQLADSFPAREQVLVKLHEFYRRSHSLFLAG